MATEEPSGGPPLPAPQFNPIPVWDSVKAAFEAVRDDLTNFFVAARVWVIVLGILDAAVLTTATDSEQLAMSGFALIVAVVRIVGTAAFLIAWHRRVLLAETIAPMGAVTIGRRQGRFIFYELVPAGLVAAIFLATQLLSLHPIITLAAIVAVFVIAIRWLLFAPLAALDIPGNLLAHSWNLSRGNGFRLFGGLLIITLLSIIPFAVLQFLYFGFSGEQISGNLFLNLIYFLATETLNFAVIAWAAGYLCHAFAAIMSRTLPLDPNDRGIFPAAGA